MTIVYHREATSVTRVVSEILNPYTDFDVVDDPLADATVSAANVTRMQAFLDASALISRGHIPAGHIVLNGTMRMPSNLDLTGDGEGYVTISSSPAYAINGPLLANPVDGSGDVIPVRNSSIRGITFDGDYLNNADYNVQCTLIDPITPASTTYTVDDTTGFSAAGRFSLVATGDNVGRVTYTSKDATHFYGCVQDTTNDINTFSADAGTVFRKFDSSVTGLVRFYAYEKLRIENVTIKNSLSYNLAAEGRPYDSNPSHRGPKKNLVLGHVTLGPSYASDCLDIKDQEGLYAYRCDATDGYDKGFNVRGRYQTWVNCVSRGCRSGFGLTSSPAVDGASRIILPLTSSITKTATSIPVGDSSAVQIGDIAYIGGVEKVEVTAVPDSTHITVLRAQGDTRAAAHASAKQFVVEWDVVDPEVAVGMIDMFGCHSDGDYTGFSLNAGGSYTRAHVSGGTVKNCTGAGMQAVSALGPMEITMVGTKFYKNQSGVLLTRCVEAGLTNVKIQGSYGNFPADPGSDVPGDGLTITDCPNGVELTHVRVSDNVGSGVVMEGTTAYVHATGPPPYQNGGEPLVVVNGGHSGDWFGVRQPGFVPSKLQETVPLREATGTLQMTAGTVYWGLFTAKGYIRAAEVFAYVTTAGVGSPTTAKFALAEVADDGVTLNVLVWGDNHPGGVFTTSGFKNNQTFVSNAKKWLEPGKRYACGALQVGQATGPLIAAVVPTLSDTSLSVRESTGGTSASVANDIPASSTLTPITTIPYMGVAISG